MPFTQSEFMQVFARYNQAIWPAQLVAYLLAITALVLIPRKNLLSDRFASAVLAAFWLMAGIVYHITFFWVINPGAAAFGGLFVLQGLFILASGVLRRGLRFEYRHGAASAVGWVLAVYAMVIYPVIGHVLGHRYPESPMFGVAPCPVVIFTFAMFLWAAKQLPRYLLVIPFLWALLGLSAATALRVYQDFGLVLSAVVAVPMIMRARRTGK